MGNSIKEKTLNATKWSSITEIAAKVVSPIINMILARILAPEAFGILATVTMVISFAEVFVESGFQKFLIQHEFSDPEEEDHYTSTAFWTNFVFSMFLWIVVIVFQDPIAKIAGNEGLGNVIAISGIMIPMYGIIGIQNCIIKKHLDFKKLFFVRIPASLVPLFVTLPLALLNFDYWSLVIGNICGVIVRSILLIIVGGYKPKLYFNVNELKCMLRYGILTMLDGLAIWATNWIDSLLIASYMTDYQLGLYKNSIGIITTLFGMVTVALTPVLYASLSRLQNDDKAFNDMFMGTQKILCMFLLPMGSGVFLYRELATDIILGSLWKDAAFIIGITAITFAIRTIFVSFNSEVYRAKGKFYMPLCVQLIDLAILIPTCISSSKIGFEALVYARALIRMDMVIPGFILMYVVCKIKPRDTFRNLLPSFVSTGVMSLTALVLQRFSKSVAWSIVSIACCIVIYFSVICLFKNERNSILGFIKKYCCHKK